MGSNTEMMANIALVQLTCHPSLRLGESFLSWEPFLDEEGPGPLQSLWDNGFNVSELQNHCRDRYLLWHRARLSAIVSWFNRLESVERPDVVVFPEGSIPRKFLSCLHKKLKSRDGKAPTIFAGTHSYEWSKEAWEDYLKLGVSVETLKELSRSPVDSLSVCPILHQDGNVTLQPKQLLSPWEITAIGVKRSTSQCVPKPIVHELSDGHRFSVCAYVCSEALQQIIGTAEAPDLLVVVSRNRDHSRFAPLEEQYAKNQIPVAYCNDGRFGGSHLCVVNDVRNENWFARAPRNGVLPPGDGILLLQTTVRHVAPSMGINNPLPTSRLLRLSSIVPEDSKDSNYRISCALSECRRLVSMSLTAGKPLDLRSISATCAQLEECEKPSAIQEIQLKRLFGLVKNQAAPLHEWNAFASDCFVTRKHYRHALNVLTHPHFYVVHPHLRDEFTQGVPILPCTLHALERQLAEHCLLGLNALLDSVTTVASSAILSVRARLLRYLGLPANPSPNVELAHLFQDMRTESEEAATVFLSSAIARIVEQYGATSGMLFIAHKASSAASDGGKTILVSTIMVNTPVQRIERQLGAGNGIVGHVGETRVPYVTDRVGTDSLETDAFLDKHYSPTVPNTLSEVAVPIMSTTSDGSTPELIGVLNLESRKSAAFSPLYIQALIEETNHLIVDMRVMQACMDTRRTVVWHPRKHGWGLGGTLDRLCHRISTTHSFGRRPPSVSCTVWYADDCKRVLFVRGTSRYDYEYVTQDTLDMDNSFIGLALKELRDGEVRSGRVEDLPRFQRRQKAERMELVRVTVSPFGVMSLSGNYAARGVVAIYGFAHESSGTDNASDLLFTRDAVSRLAMTVGHIIREIQQQKRLCATAHLAASVSSAAALWRDRLDYARKAICESLEADHATIFHIVDGGAVVGSTTGVDNPSGRYEVPLERPTGKRCGFTKFLLEEPGRTLRKHDIPNPFELCRLGDEFGMIVPENVIREEGAVTRTEHRRFLGASVGCRETVVGVLRLVRGEGDRPFVRSDEETLASLGKQLAVIIANRSFAAHGADEGCLANSSLSIGGRSWGIRAVDAWLQQYKGLCGRTFPGGTPVLASIRYVASDGHGGMWLKVLAYHSTQARNYRQAEEQSTRQRPNIGWMTIDTKLSEGSPSRRPRVITFERPETSLYACGIDHGVEVGSGVCVPLSWIGYGRVTHGVVSVDFKGRIVVTAESIAKAFANSLDLQDMARSVPAKTHTIVDKIGLDCERMRFSEMLARWADSMREEFDGVCILKRVRESELFDLTQRVVPCSESCDISHDEFREVLLSEWDFSRWDDRMAWLSSSEEMGIRFIAARRLVWMPLRVGPFSLFGFCARIGSAWLESATVRGRKDANECLKREVKRRGVSAAVVQRDVEEACGMGIEEMFRAREVTKLLDSVCDDWLELMRSGGAFWREWSVAFEEAEGDLPKELDISGLRAWAPILVPSSDGIIKS